MENLNEVHIIWNSENKIINHVKAFLKFYPISSVMTGEDNEPK